MSFKVAIIGRPNVGKSTLFNRLVGKKLALVDDTPGVTRDRREGDAKLGDLSFTIIDTAGLEEAKGDKLEARMREQTDKAIAEADVCLMLIDARAGVTPLDAHFADILRRQDKPVLLLANKCEGALAETNLYEAYSLGLGDPLAISAEHGEGMSDLYAALAPLAEELSPEGEAAMRAEGDEAFDPDADYEIDTTRPLRIAIVGRPNAGKSTLVNTLLGEDRMLTGPEAGITRDSIGVEFEVQGRPIKMFDTAGMRKKARVQQKLEKLSVADALRAIQFAEVVVLLIDAQAPLEKQDLQIADLVVREGRGLVIGINKWDLVEDRQAYTADLKEKVERLLPQVRGVPLVFFSSLTGRGIDRLMPAVFKVQELWNKRVPTAALNRWLDEALTRHPPPSVGGRRLAIRYITQIKSRPPTFALFAPRAEVLPDSYARYLVNAFREAFDVPAVPIRMLLRKGKNPYAHKAKRK
ncbi:MAG: ribosome biogenesis GTPase Der [Alphaproteobacteria bacterium]|nr:MAG: ribosome biogenesis GTPase Der [Alphaproteobacteria bacterium]